MMVVGHVRSNGIKFTVTLVPVLKIALAEGAFTFRRLQDVGDYKMKEADFYDYMEVPSLNVLELNTKCEKEAKKLAIEKLGDNYCKHCSYDRDDYFDEKLEEEENDNA